VTESAATSAAWSVLASGGAPSLSDVSVLETDTVTTHGPVLLALDADGARHLLVPIPIHVEIREDTQSAGVQIVRRVLLDEGRQLAFGDVVCRAEHLEELFTELATEMLAEIRSAPSEPVLACHRVLERWRELLGPERSQLLGANALAALFGELWFLIRVIERDSMRDIGVWTGPDGDRHDLRKGGISLEVKSSLARNGRPAEVHGHLQLEPPPDGILFLGWIRLERVRDVGQSVPDLVAELRDLGVATAQFAVKLASVGYTLGHENAYRAVRFDVREVQVYAVTDDFPRIIPASFVDGRLPPGISTLSYVIDLGQEPPNPVDDEERGAVFDRLATGVVAPDRT
jgi:hypothetical protein